MTVTGPQPTCDMEELKRCVSHYGFGMYLDAVDDATTMAIRERVLEQAAAERSTSISVTNSAVEPDG